MRPTDLVKDWAGTEESKSTAAVVIGEFLAALTTYLKSELSNGVEKNKLMPAYKEITDDLTAIGDCEKVIDVRHNVMSPLTVKELFNAYSKGSRYLRDDLNAICMTV